MRAPNLGGRTSENCAQIGISVECVLVHFSKNQRLQDFFSSEILHILIKKTEILHILIRFELFIYMVLYHDYYLLLFMRETTIRTYVYIYIVSQ